MPLDYSLDGLHYARELGVRDPVQGDVRALPFADCAFDIALSLDVLVHLPRGEEIRRRARVRPRRQAPRTGGHTHLGARYPAQPPRGSTPTSASDSRAAAWSIVFAGAGLRVLRCSYANSLLMPVALAKFRLWEPLTRTPANSGVQPVAPWLDNLLHIPLAAEAAWLGTGYNLPLGQSLILIGEKME